MLQTVSFRQEKSQPSKRCVHQMTMSNGIVVQWIFHCHRPSENL